MKMVKSLLLGSAAGLVAVAGAQAADLPVKAKAVEYVKVCSLYGAGFYYIPGTDTCIKIGGFLRTEWNHNSNGSFSQQWSGEDGYRTRSQDTLLNRSRGIVSFDVRSQTEYGTLRSYLRAGWQWTSRDSTFGGSGATTYLDRAFIQLAGFTFGKTQSFFDVPSIAGMSYQSGILWQDYGGKGTPVFAYTAALGNGVTATLSLEDHSERRGAIVDLSAGGAFTIGTANVDDGAGNHVPDIVGNLRVDQAWGSAQISGALHANRANYYGASQFGGHPGDEWGWAVGAGINLRMPWNPKDTFALAAQYGKGAALYVISTGGNPGAGGSLVANLVNQGTIGNAWADDGYFITGGAIDQSEAWSAQAGFQHYWTPTLRQSIYGIYADYQAGGQVDATVCGANLGGAGCLDWSAWQVGSRVIWNPVSNLDIGLEVMYSKIEGTACDGATCGLVNVGGQIDSPLATGDVDTWSAILRVQRNFWP